MKCVKCKFKDKNTNLCAYPFKATAVGDIGPRFAIGIFEADVIQQ
jgi:hypothetical protein